MLRTLVLTACSLSLYAAMPLYQASFDKPQSFSVDRGSAVADPAVQHNNRTSLRVESKSGDAAVRFLPVSLTIGKRYELSGWVRTEGLEVRDTDRSPIATGAALLWWPFGGVLSLTLGLAIFFLIEGAVSIMYALDHRREFGGRWGWMLVSGVVDIVLALLILAGFPGTAAWAIGLLVGINMLMGGVALVAMALHARAA